MSIVPPVLMKGPSLAALRISSRVLIMTRSVSRSDQTARMQRDIKEGPKHCSER
jgi:hypothetical protein